MKFELYTVRKSLRFSWVLESLTLKERERDSPIHIYISQRESGMQSLFIIGESGYVIFSTFFRSTRNDAKTTHVRQIDFNRETLSWTNESIDLRIFLESS